MASPTQKASSASLSKLPMPAKIGVGAGLFVLVGVAYFVMGYSEVSSQIANQKRDEQRLRQQLSEAKESETEYLKDLAALTDKQQRQRELNKILPETAESAAFLSAVQGVANVTGVALNSWEPLDEVNQQFFAKVPMKLALQGRFHQLAKFFYGVGQLDRIINVENISMREPKREADDFVVTVECLTTAFHTINPKNIRGPAKPGQPAPAGSAAPADSAGGAK